MTERQFLDANILIRLVTADNEADARAVRDYLRRGDRPVAIVTPVTLNEVVFVLRGSLYGWGRESLASAVRAILDLPLVVQDREVVEQATSLFERVHPDWADCILSAYALRDAGGALLSFDRGLDRIPGLLRSEPPRTQEPGA